jgi:hypothetical protein
MPPKKLTRGQWHLAGIHSRPENRGIPLSRVTLTVNRGGSKQPEDEIHDKNDYNHEVNTADVEDDPGDGQDDNLNDILGNSPSKPEPTMQSEIVSMRKTMEEQPEMLIIAIQQNTQLRVPNAEQR